MRNFIFFVFCLFLVKSAQAGFTFASGNLETKVSADRPELEYNLNHFDVSHLDRKLSKADAIRFERRTGIGAPVDRVSQWIGLTRQQAIEKTVFELNAHSDGFKIPLWFENMIPVSFIEDGLRRERHSCGIKMFRYSLEAAWAKELVESTTPQFERLALFWLNHFSVAFDTYSQTHSYTRHIEIIRENTSGNFLDFLNAILYDPAMIVYLNNEKSTVQNPNENLAREFLELFSLGEGRYSENEVKNLAKALAGHGINFVTEQFQLYNSKVARVNFSAFGKNYNNINEFIELISEHPSFGELLARKFYSEYVELNDPNEEDLAYLVTSFKNSGFEITELLKATLSLKKFWDDQNKLTLVKSPIELIFGTIRTFGTAGNSGKNFGWAKNVAEEFGQSLFNPPNVAGWPSGKEWLSGQRLERRLTQFPYYFSSLFDSKNPSRIQDMKSGQIDKKARRILALSKKYSQDLENFFSSSSSEQFLAETMVINWIPEDFSTREYGDIDVSFYNVAFMGKKWDGISVRLGTDVNSKKKQRWKKVNRLGFKQGRSFPAVLKTYKEGYVSDWDGHRGWETSFPNGPHNKFRSKSKEEQLLMKRLLQAMSIALKNLSSFNALFNNKDAQNWLHKQLDEVGLEKIKTANGMVPPVRIFSLLSSPDGSKIKKQKFNCSIERVGISIPNQSLNSSQKLSEAFDFRHLVYRDKTHSLSELLLPALNLSLDNQDAFRLLSHEGYQLR